MIDNFGYTLVVRTNKNNTPTSLYDEADDYTYNITGVKKINSYGGINMKYIIGVDIGTTSTKTILFDDKGTVIESSNDDYPLYQDSYGMAEEDPDEIFSAVISGMSKVIRKSKINRDDLSGVSFSCAMHSLILLDENFNPLTRAITWADNRASRYAKELKESDLGQTLYEHTGTPIHPMTPLSKIIWLKNEQHELYKKHIGSLELKSIFSINYLEN